jgi:hypothetical protein
MLQAEWIKCVGASALVVMLGAGCASAPDQGKCVSADEAAKSEKAAMAAEEAAKAPEPAMPPAAPPAAPAKPSPKSSSVAGTENQLLVDQNIPGVSFAITAPAADATLPAGQDVEVKFDLKGYNTGEEIGQHVHVIVDNEPYLAHYDATKPLMLKDLKPGTHTIRAFPSRHYHLSLKQGPVFQVVTFHVEQKTEGYSFDAKKPFITYSRPKGSYKAADIQAGLLLDFYVSNAKLGKDSKVVYGVDGAEQELTTWKPVLLPAMAPGKHTITLKLVDMKGKPIVNGGFNDTTREVTITE